MVSKEDVVGLQPPVFNLVRDLGAFFTKNGIDAFIVGGFIRDFLLDRAASDIDLAIDSDSFLTGGRLATHFNARLVKLDGLNQVARIVLPGTLVFETGISHLDITGIDGGITGDLARRDFSINAIACPLEKWPASDSREGLLCSLIDPCRGIESIKNRTIAAVNDQAFEADSLRLLRGVRLAAELDFSIEPHTLELIKLLSYRIQNGAAERIREELLNILKLPVSGRVISHLDELDILGRIIPELIACKETVQPKEHHWNVFWHSVKCVEAIEFLLDDGAWPYADAGCKDLVPLSAEILNYFKSGISADADRLQIIKFAALLHDIAKPVTRIINDAGRIRFFGHPVKGAPLTESILGKLRFSGREAKMAADLTLHHLRPVQMNQPDQMPTDRAVYRYLRDTGDVAVDTLFLSLADHLAARGPALDQRIWRLHCDVVRHVLDKKQRMESCRGKPRLINGHDLLDNFKLPPGPMIKSILEAVAEAQALGEITTRGQALRLAAKIVNQQQTEETDRSGYRRGKGILKPR